MKIKNLYCKFSNVILLIFPLILLSEHFCRGEIHRNVLRDLNLNKKPLNTTIWVNDGYQETNATQISHKWNGAQLNVSAHFLMATSMARMYTLIQNFNGRFLSIKFRSMIGNKKSNVATTIMRTTLQTTTMKTKPTTTLSTTSTTATTAMPTTTTPMTTATTTTTMTPNPTDDDAPAVIQLQSKSEESGQIIEIQLDNNEHGQIAITPEEPAPAGTPEKRKKRELNSQEISQIHEIISQATTAAQTKNNINKETKTTISTSGENSTHKKSSTGHVQGTSTSVIPIVVDAEGNVDPHSQYKTWKASLSQSFRPSGFYVLVDDQVVYDNWEGIWTRGQPNILGRHVQSSASDIWCHTEILLEWEESPKKDIKVRFEWDPPSTSSFLFLNDIVISTISAPSHAHPEYSPHMESNKNITLYIVVKQHNEEANKEKGTTTMEPPTTTVAPPTSTTTATPPITNLALPPVPENKMEKSTGTILSGDPNQTLTLIIIVILGAISFFILVVLMHTKFKENKRLRGSYC